MTSQESWPHHSGNDISHPSQLDSDKLPFVYFTPTFVIVIIYHDMGSFIIAPILLTGEEHLKGNGLPSTVIQLPFKEEAWRIKSCLEDALGFSKAFFYLFGYCVIPLTY